MKVKCRIALAIDSKGKWSACGWDGAEDDTVMGGCLDSLDEGERRYWVEVEVEQPEASAETVQGVANEA